MKILIVDTYYSGFLISFWGGNQELIKSTNYEQIKGLLESRFGTSDYYSYNLKSLGHKVFDIIANDQISQLSWAREQSVQVKGQKIIDALSQIPIINHFVKSKNWINKIFLSQLTYYRPDVVYLQDLSIFKPSTLAQIKKTAFLVGQIASPLPAKEYLTEFGLILTSFPHYVTKLRKMGINSEYLKIGFESRVVKELGKLKKKYGVSFVGSFTGDHIEGTRTLEQLAKTVPVHVWGRGIESLSPDSPLRQNYHGEAWGIDMYKIFASSKIVINRHSQAAQKYANNMRLYESTGMGSLLVTDYKENLDELFKLDKEVVCYRNAGELIDKVQYFLTHDKDREKIALAGQKRTLKDHTYAKRMRELITIIKSYYDIN